MRIYVQECVFVKVSACVCVHACVSIGSSDPGAWALGACGHVYECAFEPGLDPRASPSHVPLTTSAH